MFLSIFLGSFVRGVVHGTRRSRNAPRNATGSPVAAAHVDQRTIVVKLREIVAITDDRARISYRLCLKINYIECYPVVERSLSRITVG